MKIKWIYYILIIAFIIRIINLGTPLLDQDEAETLLASQIILESGFPRGYNQIPFYENSYLLETDDEMYKYLPTNYPKTTLVLKKGWLTYYVVAFTSLMSENEFMLRFPFVIVSIIAMWLFYKISVLLFNKRVALIATLLYALSPTMISYDRMLRYYSLMMMLLFATIYFYLLAKKEKKYYVWSGLSLGLLAHTNILIAFALSVFLVIDFIVYKRKINIDVYRGIGISALLYVPWMLIVKLPWNIANEPNKITHSAEFIYHTIIAGIANQGSLYMLFFIGLVLVFFTEKKWRVYAFLTIMIIVPSILAPFSSFEQKLFLSIVPIMILVSVIPVEFILTKFEKHKITIPIIILLLIVSFIHIQTPLGKESYGKLSVFDLYGLEKDSTFGKIGKIVSSYDNDTLILTTFNQFPMTHYYNRPVQIIWPIQESFISNYRDEMIIIEIPPKEGYCRFFFQYLKNDNCNNYDQKIKHCQKTSFDNINIYECPKNESLIGGGPGLFFSDFPKNQPPDFIWDRVPFPVSIKVDNYGEQEVNELKVFFTGDLEREWFGGTENLTINPNIPRNELQKNEVVPGTKFIELTNITYTPKLITSERLINFSVTLCYEYETIIKPKICEYNLCGYEISGGPVNIKDVHYKDMTLKYNITLASEGEIVNYPACENSKPIVDCGLTECDFTNRTQMKIKYAHKIDFIKSILLRSQELNEHDFQNK